MDQENRGFSAWEQGTYHTLKMKMEMIVYD